MLSLEVSQLRINYCNSIKLVMTAVVHYCIENRQLILFTFFSSFLYVAGRMWPADQIEFVQQVYWFTILMLFYIILFRSAWLQMDGGAETDALYGVNIPDYSCSCSWLCRLASWHTPTTQSSVCRQSCTQLDA